LDGADKGLLWSGVRGSERRSGDPVVSEMMDRTRMISAAHWTQDRRLLEESAGTTAARLSHKSVDY